MDWYTFILTSVLDTSSLLGAPTVPPMPLPEPLVIDSRPEQYLIYEPKKRLFVERVIRNNKHAHNGEEDLSALRNFASRRNYKLNRYGRYWFCICFMGLSVCIAMR